MKPHDCSQCPLVQIGQGFTRTEGEAKLGVAFVLGEAGRHEAEESLPARPNGESGALLTHIVERNLKLKRNDFLWDHIIRCKPPGDWLKGGDNEETAIRNCNSYSNSRWGSESGIRVIVAFGQAAFRSLTGISGKKRNIEDVRGYVFESPYGLVVPSLDPAFIRRGNSRFTSALIHDIKKAIAISAGSYVSYFSNVHYVHPVLNIASESKLGELVALYYRLKANPSLTIYYDIENPYTKTEEEDEKGDGEEEEAENKQIASEYVTGQVLTEQPIEQQITSVQFATSRTWAITVPWKKPFIKVAQAILRLPNDKVGSNNWHHDDPRLRANGCEINGTIHDVMWAWKHFQPGLWKGLQRIASFFDFPYIWKHYAIDEDKEDEYGGSDVISLAYIWEQLPTRMRQMGVWESYLKFKVRLRQSVLKPMENRGLFVDEQERQELKVWCAGQVEKEDLVLQEQVPLEIRNITPKRKDKKTGEISYGYIREPTIIKQLRAGYESVTDVLTNRGVARNNIRPFTEWAESRSGFVCREFTRLRTQDSSELITPDEPEDTEYVNRWCNLQPFKASSQQIIKYLNWQLAQPGGKKRGYYVPQDLKRKTATTGKRELYEVYEATADPVLESVIKIRSLAKMLGNDIPNWAPASDGCVHTLFKHDPPSWQLNSIGPNIQNARKHEPDPIAKVLRLGERFRKIVKAPPGRCVVEFDKASFHVTMMGFEARDPLYLQWAKRDMHTFLTSYIVNEPIPINLSESDAKLAIKEIKGRFKSIRDTQGKPTVLGNQLGLGATKLWKMNATFLNEEGKRQVGIANKKQAEKLQALLAHLFPKVEAYKSKIKEQAHYRSYLQSSFGAIRWFYDVLRWDYKGKCMRNGSEAEEAQSHNLQSDAFGEILSKMLWMGEHTDWLEKYWAANTVHDSVVMFPLVEHLEECIENVRGALMTPTVELSDHVCCPNGLVVGVDVSVSAQGGNWAPWNEIRNPMGLRERKM